MKHRQLITLLNVYNNFVKVTELIQGSKNLIKGVFLTSYNIGKSIHKVSKQE